MAMRDAGHSLRRALLIVAVLVVAALVLPPFISVSRYKSGVVEALSKAFGRPVTCDSIELRLLPQPGFYLANVTIGDDPAYSLEPILHADEVTAYLGLSSLWRARMEIARVNLNYPSLNLAERDDGSWNFEPLLWKTSRIQAAPTSAKPSATRLRFPYIEASNGRINFKYGLEKSVFSLTDASFKLWSPAENQWRMRLEAQPVRTDMPVTDTGRVKAEATMRRAPMLRDAPIAANISWQSVQLGSLTRLISGADGGWRGTLQASAQFSGSASALRFSTAATLRDVRRFDIASADEANLNATCRGEWSASANLQNTECSLPLDDGLLSAKGTMRGFHSPRYDLSLSAQNVGAAALLNLARHTKRNLPDDLTGTGSLSGALHISRLGDAPASCIGSLDLQSLLLHSSVLGKDLAIGKAVIAANIGAPPAPGPRNRRAKSTPPLRGLQVQSFELPLGGAAPVKVDGTLDAASFALHLKGDATLERLQQFARAFGIGAPRFSLAGPAAIDLLIGGKWTSLAAPQLSGSAQLKDARADVPGLSLPVQISSARVELDGDRISLRNTSASVGKLSLGGSATFPRSCTLDSACQARFDLSSDELNPARWNELLNPHLRKTPWYFFGGGESAGNVFSNLRASGHLAARRLTLETVTGSAFESDFSFANGVLHLTGARATMLGGDISGNWTMDFSHGAPRVASDGAAERIQVEKLAPLLKAPLGAGRLNLQYSLKASGWDAAALAGSSKGEASFTWAGGALRISPDARTPLRVLSGRGKTVLDSQGFVISDSEWRTPTGVYLLSGSISRDAALKLEFSQDDGSIWRVGGTFAKPQPAAPETAATQARRR